MLGSFTWHHSISSTICLQARARTSSKACWPRDPHTPSWSSRSTWRTTAMSVVLSSNCLTHCKPVNVTSTLSHTCRFLSFPGTLLAIKRVIPVPNAKMFFLQFQSQLLHILVDVGYKKKFHSSEDTHFGNVEILTWSGLEAEKTLNTA